MCQIVLLLLISLVSVVFIKIDAAETDPLILTPLLILGNRDEARNASEVDPAHFLGVKSNAGFITVKQEYGSNLFFWYFPHEDPTVPLIIFLSGGPGASSLLGLFNGVGPFEVDKNLTLKLRVVTWADDYSLLFIDQPVGAGFSFTNEVDGYATNEDDVGSQLYIFLQQFLEIFPEVWPSPLFITGQSYAGKYVPAFALYIHRNRGRGKPINLKGISIGNPLIDLRYMFLNYNKLMRELSFMSSRHLDRLRALEEEGLRFIDKGMLVNASNKFNQSIEYIKAHTGVSVYNLLEDPAHISSNAEDFVKRPDIREHLHVGNASFDLDNQLVYQYMLADIANTTKPFIEELLEGYGVFIYSGQLDMIVPHSGTKRLLDELQWSRCSEYRNAQRKKVFRGSNRSVAAYKQSGGNLVEAVISNSGHNVPAQAPEVIKFLLDSFIQQFK